MKAPLRRSPHRSRFFYSQLVSALSLCGVGCWAAACDMKRLGAEASVDIIADGAAALEGYFDDRIALAAIPGMILQLETLRLTLPEDRRVTGVLMKAYVTYGYGWLEEDLEAAQQEGDFARQAPLLARLRRVYRRVKDLGLGALRRRDDGLDAARFRLPAWEAYLERKCRSPADAELLLWTGYGWISEIRAAADVPELVLELPQARALVERSVELRPAYAHYAGTLLLAALDAARPAALGGNPARARSRFEQVLRQTGRKVFAVHYAYAKSYAVQMQDRALFVELLREVVEGGDPLRGARLSNRIAQRRSMRLLSRVDELF